LVIWTLQRTALYILLKEEESSQFITSDNIDKSVSVYRWAKWSGSTYLEQEQSDNNFKDMLLPNIFPCLPSRKTLSTAIEWAGTDRHFTHLEVITGTKKEFLSQYRLFWNSGWEEWVGFFPLQFSLQFEQVNLSYEASVFSSFYEMNSHTGDMKKSVLSEDEAELHWKRIILFTTLLLLYKILRGFFLAFGF
jgi:hypothetical protein